MVERFVWFGRLTTASHLARVRRALVWPALVWLLGFMVFPAVALLFLAFSSRGSDGEIVWSLSIESVKRILGFGVLGWSADYLRIFWRSLWVATATTALALLFAFPIALWISASSKAFGRILLGLIVIPMCTNLVVRTYALEVVLSPGMPPATFAGWLGLVEPGRGIYPSAFAVIIGMVANALPFAVLPLYTSLERMDWALVEAARDLYASRWLTFRHGVLPQAIPGLVVAVIFTFVPTMGMFVVSDRLGGSTFSLIGNQIQQQFGMSRDYPFGAMLSLILMVLTLLGLDAYRKAQRKDAE